MNEEKPRSSVMPRSLLCGCLSSAAVDSVVDRAATANPERRQGWQACSRLAAADWRQAAAAAAAGRPGRAVLTKGRLAAVDMPQDAYIDVEGARGGRKSRGCSAAGTLVGFRPCC